MWNRFCILEKVWFFFRKQFFLRKVIPVVCELFIGDNSFMKILDGLFEFSYFLCFVDFNMYFSFQCVYHSDCCSFACLSYLARCVSGWLVKEIEQKKNQCKISQMKKELPVYFMYCNLMTIKIEIYFHYVFFLNSQKQIFRKFWLKMKIRPTNTCKFITKVNHILYNRMWYVIVLSKENECIVV